MFGGAVHYRLIKKIAAIHLFVLALCAASSGRAEPAAMDKVFKYYQDLKTFDANFKQTKLLSQEKLELKSEGTLRVSLGHGLLYEIKSPGRLTVFLDQDKLEIHAGEGAAATVSRYALSGGEYSEKIAENLHELTALLAMNRQELAKTYEVTEDKATPGTLALTPKVARQFSRVVMVVEPAAWIKRIEIEERSGDRMVLDFEAPRPADAGWVKAWAKSG